MTRYRWKIKNSIERKRKMSGGEGGITLPLVIQKCARLWIYLSRPSVARRNQQRCLKFFNRHMAGAVREGLRALLVLPECCPLLNVASTLCFGGKGSQTSSNLRFTKTQSVARPRSIIKSGKWR